LRKRIQLVGLKGSLGPLRLDTLVLGKRLPICLYKFPVDIQANPLDEDAGGKSPLEARLKERF
jgi:hypothetical protein